MTDDGRKQRPGPGNAPPAETALDRPIASIALRRESASHPALISSTQAEIVRPVPFVPTPPFDSRLVFTDQGAHRASAFRMLRQRLMDREGVRCVLCTSANAGEGKTTLAANLALAFAELGQYRVLLVEANFRRASLATVFGFDAANGFRGQIVRHRIHPTEPWSVVQIGPPPMYILAMEKNACARCLVALMPGDKFCGSCGAGVEQTDSVMLDSVGFKAAIGRFRQVFDYIVIDGPSVLSGGDVNLIQDCADAIILASRKGVSDQRSMRRAIEQLAPAPLAAAVLLDG